MKVLVVSSTPWNDSNSFGLTFSNIFAGIDGLEFANIYCSAGSPDNRFKMECFQITISDIINNLKDRKYPTGKRIANNSGQGRERTSLEQQNFDIARTLRWQILFWGRDLIWKIGKWKSKELEAFLDGFQPDLIFQPVYYSSYLNDIAQYVKQYTGAPMIGYISDDNYTLKQLHISPLYWFDRLCKRRKVKKTISMCRLLYVISDIQKEEYTKIFGNKCKILTKCAKFDDKYRVNIKRGRPIKFVYAGNIDRGRRKSLKLIADSISKLHSIGYEVQFDVYTGTPRTSKLISAINRNGSCFLHSSVPYEQLIAIQKKADVLVHVEGLSLKSRLEVHQSFSTKLVDYFELGKCIFAVGKEDVASIKHLLEHDAAIVAQNRENVYFEIKKILDNPQIISRYGALAYECGKEYHNKEVVQGMLMQDIMNVIKYEKGENMFDLSYICEEHK